MSNVQPPKRRNRVAQSCNNCRQRKAKCDRGRPACGRCVLYNCSDTCEYEDVVEVSKGGSFPEAMENGLLKNRIKELESIVSHQQNMLDNNKSNNSTTPNSDSSAFSWYGNSPTSSNGTLVGNNESYLQKFDGFSVIESNLFYQGPTSFMSTILEDTDSSSLFAGYFKEKILAVRESVLSCFGQPDEIDPTRIMLLGKFPPVNYLDSLFNEFFDLFQQFLVFFDKQVLLSQIHHLLDDKGSYSVINNNKSNQSSLIAIFLILLRLSYLTKKWDSIDTNLFVNESYIEIASGLLMAPSSFKHVSLAKIQGLLLLRIYKMHAPEEDDSSFSTAVIDACLVQAARIQGLHRPPSKYPNAYSSFGTTWQKTWIYICFHDALSAFDKGTETLVENRHLHKMTSHLDEGNSNAILQVTNEVSHALNKFMKGQISDRIVNVPEVLELAQSLSAVTSMDMLAFDNLLSVESPEDFDVSNKSQRAFRLEMKLSLMQKEAVLYYLLYCCLKDSNEKLKYLSLSFERTLISLRVTQIWLGNPTLFGEISQLVFPRFWVGPRMLTCSMMTVFVKATEGRLDLGTMLKYFNSPDGHGIADWAGIVPDGRTSIGNTIKTLLKVFSETSKYSSKYYSCFKACMFMRACFDHVKLKYPEFWAEQQITQDNFDWKNETPWERLFVFWSDKNVHATSFNVESLFSGFDGNPDLSDFYWTDSVTATTN